MKWREKMLKGLLGLGCLLGGTSSALAQNPYDPPTAVRPPPNVMLLLDATMTTTINPLKPADCHAGGCHEPGHGLHSSTIWANGGTRLQLARQVLTGGYGWNVDTTKAAASADAKVSAAGVMDAFKVRHA